MLPPASPPQRQPTHHQGVAAEALQRRVLLYDKWARSTTTSSPRCTIRAQLRPRRLALLAGSHVAGRRRPLFVARRIVRMAVEDIGLAAPEALNLASPRATPCTSSARPKATSRWPGRRLPRARAQIERRLHRLRRRLADIDATAAEPVPLHLRNAPTGLMKSLDYGKGYQYAHDVEGRVADMECLPPSLAGRRYYHPTQEGREKLLAQRMDESRAFATASASRNHSRVPHSSRLCLMRWVGGLPFILPETHSSTSRRARSPPAPGPSSAAPEARPARCLRPRNRPRSGTPARPGEASFCVIPGSLLVQSAFSSAKLCARSAVSTSADRGAARSLNWQLRRRAAVKSRKTGWPTRAPHPAPLGVRLPHQPAPFAVAAFVCSIPFCAAAPACAAPRV